MPSGYDAVEPELRKALQAKIKRGSVNVSLTLVSDAGEPQFRVNETALKNALDMVERIGKEIKCEKPRAEGILALRGVMEQAEEVESAEARDAFIAALVKNFSNAVDRLAAARDGEGDAMKAVLADQFDTVEKLVEEAGKLAEGAPEALKARIAAQLDELLAGTPVPEERLAQEAALLALKADVREEIDRLKSHIEAGRALLQETTPVGRQLDFLTQEFNREANTLCSKAQDMTLKRVGLELKKVIDQLREQVQNIE